MKVFVLEEHGMQMLDSQELMTVEGGSWWNKVIKGTLWYEAVSGIINDWDNVKKAFVDGWNIDQPKK